MYRWSIIVICSLWVLNTSSQTYSSGVIRQSYSYMEGLGNTYLFAEPGKRLYLNSDYSLTEQQPSGNADRNWTGSSYSSIGNKYCACYSSGRLYVKVGTGGWNAVTLPSPASSSNRSFIGCYGQAFVQSSTTYHVWVTCIGSGTGAGCYRSVRSTGTSSWSAIGGSTGYTLLRMKSTTSSTITTESVAQGIIVGTRDAGVLTGNTTLTQVDPTGEGLTGDWYAVGMSQSATYAIAGMYGKRLYIKLGGSWAETQPAGDVDAYWYAADIYRAGSTTLAIAAQHNGKIYLYAGSWSEIYPTGASVNVEWTDVAIYSPSRIYVSAASGVHAGLYYYNGQFWTKISDKQISKII